MKRLLFTLFLPFCVVGFALAQRMVTGSVTDQATGEALPGASILFKGTPVGGVTDVGGAFSLAAPKGATTLVISYTGYETQELALTASNVYRIALVAGVTLGETVVTALGIARSEKSLGYAVAKVDGSEVARVGDVNIINSLAGRAAGVQVIGSSGNLGGSSRITIRGIKSINGNNQPLFVVDGVPMDNSNFTTADQARGGGAYDYGNAIQDLNPDDIQDINVLKGQAAAALYGSRGANGVIMVTTKKGSKTKKGIGVSVSTGLTLDEVFVLPKYQDKYGGGLDLRPRGYADNSGEYDVPFVQFTSGGDTAGVWSSFDLVPIYGVDESFGVRFENSTNEHFQHLEDLAFGNGQDRYSFLNGFGNNQDHLMFRDWNTWDAWDTQNFGKSRLWESAPNSPRDFFQTGKTFNNSIAFEGGGDKSTFRLAYNRINQTGILPNSELTRNTLSFNGALDLSDRLAAFVGVNYVNGRTLGRSATGYDGGGGINPAQNFNQWWQRQVRIDDLAAYENPDGTMRTWNRISATNPSPQYWDNPFWARYKNFQNDGRDRIYGNVGLTWKLNSWLSATGRVLSDSYTERREERIAVGSIALARYSYDLYNVGETNSDLMLRASRSLTDDLTLDAFVGGNKLWRTTKNEFGGTRGGLNVPGLYTIQNSLERPDVRNRLTEKQIESVFAGANFGFKNYLYLDLSGRNDWSSALPTDNNSYFYPAASLAWVFSENVNIPAVSFAKLRLGWAKVGNDTDPYSLFNTYTSVDNFGSNPAFTVPGTLNNANLKPEETRSTEAGIDLRFFKDRLGLDVTAYDGKTTNQIIPLGTTPTTGYSRQFINAGEITNRGIEIELSVTPIKMRDFQWDLSFNWGKNVNKIVDLNAEDPTLTNLPITNAPFAASLNAYEGESFGTILGTNYLYDGAGNKLIDGGGFYIASTDVMPIGNITPDFTGGVSNRFSWKGLSLNVLIDFRKGGDIFSTTNMWGNYSGIFEKTAEGTIREDGVINEGVFAKLDADGALVQTGGQSTDTKLDDTYESTGEKNALAVGAQDHFFLDGGYILSAADVYDGSFVKLREMSVGYTLPKKWLGRSNIQGMRLAIVGRNLAILSKNIPNVDPDSAISSGNVQGIEGGALPGTRSFGVNLSFNF